MAYIHIGTPFKMLLRVNRSFWHQKVLRNVGATVTFFEKTEKQIFKNSIKMKLFKSTN